MDVFHKFKLVNIFFIGLIFICEILSSEVSRPRGVSLSRASLYIPEKDFECFDGSKTIPYSQINDDYCDCPDGSDEPGTSACLQGTFHCTNAGHKPQNIASSRVNDGICDCCDGSDEYANKRANCVNKCLEMGRVARAEAQRQAELVKAGKQLKAELSQRGLQMKQEKKTKLDELQKNREEALLVKTEKELLKKEAEDLENVALDYYRKLEEEAKKKKAEAEAAKTRAEAEETFIKFDSNQDGKIDISELQTRQTFDKDKNGEVSAEEAKFFLNNEESVDLETFIANCWANIKPYLMMDAGLFKPPAAEETHQDEADDMQDEEEEESELPEDGDDEEEPEEEEQHEEEQVQEPSSSITYDEETQILVEKASTARDEFTQADQAVKDIDSEIRRIQDYLENDYGPEEEFATLEGQCFDYTDHEYIYKLCPFEKTSQQPKSSSSETKLGAWGRWSGPDDNKYESMLYERGQSCWNGPQRSTTVRISCGSESKITSVSEPNRCEYLFDFITPAACREAPSDITDELHDEL